MTDERRNYTRRTDDYVTRYEHEDIERRVGVTESKLDRITWLIVATLAATIVDIVAKINH